MVVVDLSNVFRGTFPWNSILGKRGAVETVSFELSLSDGLLRTNRLFEKLIRWRLRWCGTPEVNMSKKGPQMSFAFGRARLKHASFCKGVGAVGLRFNELSET